MDITARLELFIDIVQHGSFSKVADLHNIDRSVVSKQIKALETELDVRLLNRSTRSISVTDAGKEVFKQAEIVRDALANTRKVAESFHTVPKGLIRITSFTSFGQLYLRKAINTFMKRYPETYVDLILDDKRSDIIGEKFDIAFRIGPPQNSSLIAKKLAANNLAILASTGFINQYGEPKTLEELIKLPAIVYSNGEFHLNKIEISENPDSHQMIKRVMNARYRANDTGSLISATEDGLGYSLVSLSILDRHIDEKGLIPLLTNYRLSDEHGGIYAVYPHRNQTPVVKLFIETVLEVIGTPPVWESYIDNYSSLYN